MYSLISLTCGSNLKVRIFCYSIAISSDIAFLSFFLIICLRIIKSYARLLDNFTFCGYIELTRQFLRNKNSILHIAYMLFVLARRNSVKLWSIHGCYFSKILKYCIWISDFPNFFLY